MSYRDELNAAHQQIEALKSQLEALTPRDGDAQERLQEELIRQRLYIRQLEQHIANIEQSQPRAAPGLLTSYEHNRSRPNALPSTFPLKRAGVLCPYCASIALHHGAQETPEHIEMVFGPNVFGDHIAGVICPKCLWSSYIKLT